MYPSWGTTPARFLESAPCYAPRVMLGLLPDLDSFLQEHRRCGELDSSVEEGRVWMTCDGCGAGLSRSLLRADKLRGTLAEEEL
jgi:hypothetical protein